MSLSQHQQKFAQLVGLLIQYVYEYSGWGITFGEAYRTPEQAAIYAESGAGILDSLHIQRLAIDLNFFIDGIYQSNTSNYLALGEYWKSLNANCRWGGDFKSRPDGNHFQYNIPTNKPKEA
jgi:hypothetical protein